MHKKGVNKTTIVTLKRESQPTRWVSAKRRKEKN